MLTDPKNSQPSLEKGGSEKLVSLLPLLKALEKYLEKELLPYSVDGCKLLSISTFFSEGSTIWYLSCGRR